jgi:hypothetical protein
MRRQQFLRAALASGLCVDDNGEDFRVAAADARPSIRPPVWAPSPIQARSWISVSNSCADQAWAKLPAWRRVQSAASELRSSRQKVEGSEKNQSQGQIIYARGRA